MSSRSYNKIKEDLLKQLGELPKEEIDSIIAEASNIKKAPSFTEDTEFEDLVKMWGKIVWKSGSHYSDSLKITTPVEVEIYPEYDSANDGWYIESFANATIQLDSLATREIRKTNKFKKQQAELQTKIDACNKLLAKLTKKYKVSKNAIQKEIDYGGWIN